MATDLADNATHEDIVQAVDKIVEDRKGEQSSEPEEKGDAQKIAEERDKPVTDTSAETDSGSEDTASDGEDTGDSEDQAQDWLDDDLKAEVAAYGIGEEELADFTSREEVERALRFADRSDLEAGRKARADRDDKGRFVKQEPEPKSEPKEGQYEISLTADVYDEDLIAEFTRMRDHYESRLDALEARFTEADAVVKQQQFDAAVDAMKHSDLFGTTGKEGRKELERRQELFTECEDIMAGRQMHGREVGSYELLVNRVARMVFADELGKKDLKARTRKLSKQSSGVVSVGTGKSPEPAESLRDEARRLYKELEGA